MDRIFVTGIGTDVGKTVVSAIITEALEADYWKPIQTGSQDYSDTHIVRDLISNKKSVLHDEAYRLTTPMSPHAAAELEGVTIEAEKIIRPDTENTLVIEGAGGVLVPLSDKYTVAELIDPEDKVIVVSSGYLGSINHTLLTLQYLEDKGLNCVGVIYNRVNLPGTIEIIEKIADVPTLGELQDEKEIDAHTISRYAELFRDELKEI